MRGVLTRRARRQANIVRRALIGGIVLVLACALGCRSERAANGTHRGVDPAARSASASAGSASAAASVIRDYYTAIDAHDYRRAYAAWERGGAASGQSFEAFQHGFDSTAAVTVQLGEPGRIEGAAGSRYVTIPVQVTARTTSGDVQHFRGSYVLRRAVVTGASPEQRTWHIYSADIVPGQ